MDDGWVGRKLMLASRALARRYAEHEAAAGPAGPMVSAIATTFLREIGRSIALSEADARLPFARARGVLRLPQAATDRAFAQAFNGLALLAADYLGHLPGATEQHRRFSTGAVAHATRSCAYLQRLFARGLRDSEAERLFGGVAVLVFAVPAALELPADEQQGGAPAA